MLLNVGLQQEWEVPVQQGIFYFLISISSGVSVSFVLNVYERKLL
jgi:hypothetical protein